MLECYFCKKEKEEKEVGKNLFWCPRLRSFDNGLTYYGSWVCLECCKDSFFKNSYDQHLAGSWCGSCPECDFPVGAILEAKKLYGIPSKDLLFVIKRDDKFRIEQSRFHITDQHYYSFKWNHNFNALKLVKRVLSPFDGGIDSLVLRHEKLPTRIVIVLEDTLTFDPLSWRELNRYYWSSIGAPQHFREEEWMDQASVIICSGYLNETGLCFDKKIKKKIDNLTKIIFKQKQK